MKRPILFFLSVFFLFPLLSHAQAVPNRHAVPGHRYLKEYWGQPELYLEHQAWYLLDLADRALQANKPSTKVNLEREMALTSIDAVLHEPNAKDNPTVKDFIAKRLQYVIDDLDKPLSGKKSLRVYKLYNCSMLFRTRDMTVAVDLNGRAGRLIPDEIMEQIVSKIDILFYTHNHKDHIDANVRDLCHKLGKPIYATEEIYKDDPNVHHVRFADVQKIGIDIPAGHLDVHVLPGHQDALQNNIWVVSLPNGKTVCATGDQWLSDKSDMVWLKDVYKRLPAIDVLAMDCWIHDYNEHVADFAPKLIVSQHENELGHGIDHREAYWITLYKNDNFYKVAVPYVLMTWGEWFDYK